MQDGFKLGCEISIGFYTLQFHGVGEDGDACRLLLLFGYFFRVFFFFFLRCLFGSYYEGEGGKIVSLVDRDSLIVCKVELLFFLVKLFTNYSLDVLVGIKEGLVLSRSQTLISILRRGGACGFREFAEKVVTLGNDHGCHGFAARVSTHENLGHGLALAEDVLEILRGHI